ncbi:MAG: GspH/FimT family pseudopilin [Deltaproteobacteria bacterium]|nr:GspH/FimT family pseudopilin [Deltaproteobacteria bacterium]
MPKRKQRMNLPGNHRGFTLTELMIVVALMAILAAIAVPNIIAQMPKYRLNGAARQVLSDLMAARMKAVSLNQDVKVSFSGSDHLYQIWNDANGNGTVADDEGDDIARDINPDYYDVTFSASANPVFQPRGIVAPGSTITLTNSSGLKKYVKVAPGGRVKIEDTP